MYSIVVVEDCVVRCTFYGTSGEGSEEELSSAVPLCLLNKTEREKVGESGRRKGT